MPKEYEFWEGRIGLRRLDQMRNRRGSPQMIEETEHASPAGIEGDSVSTIHALAVNLVQLSSSKRRLLGSPGHILYRFWKCWLQQPGNKFETFEKKIKSFCCIPVVKEFGFPEFVNVRYRYYNESKLKRQDAYTLVHFILHDFKLNYSDFNIPTIYREKYSELDAISVCGYWAKDVVDYLFDIQGNATLSLSSVDRLDPERFFSERGRNSRALIITNPVDMLLTIDDFARASESFQSSFDKFFELTPGMTETRKNSPICIWIIEMKQVPSMGPDHRYYEYYYMLMIYLNCFFAWSAVVSETYASKILIGEAAMSVDQWKRAVAENCYLVVKNLPYPFLDRNDGHNPQVTLEKVGPSGSVSQRLPADLDLLLRKAEVDSGKWTLVPGDFPFRKSDFKHLKDIDEKRTQLLASIEYGPIPEKESDKRRSSRDGLTVHESSRWHLTYWASPYRSGKDRDLMAVERPSQHIIKLDASAGEEIDLGFNVVYAAIEFGLRRSAGSSAMNALEHELGARALRVLNAGNWHIVSIAKLIDGISGEASSSQYNAGDRKEM